MCNIAGYVGTQNATPILLKMVIAQEGLDAGFFSGLAVHDGECIGYRKVRGDFASLLKRTDAEKLAGKTGIIHSRTPSGGDDSWAHPFVTERDGEVKIAYVANGSYGKYRATKNDFDKIADKLEKNGYPIPCKIFQNLPNYNHTADGASVHMSDVMCQLIYRYMCEGMCAPDAMTKAFTEMPSEIVGLLLDKNAPDRIFFSRINMPMFVGFDESGAYLASCPTAFPDSVKEYKLLPALSSGVLYKDRIEIVKYPSFPNKVRGFNKITVANAEQAILDVAKTGEPDIYGLRNAIRPKRKTDALLDVESLAYLTLTRLVKAGKLRFVHGTYTVGEQIAPKIRFQTVE